MGAAAARHLEPEEVAEFIEGVLGEPDRGRAIDHLLSCDDCRELLTESARRLVAFDSEPAGAGAKEAR